LNPDAPPALKVSVDQGGAALSIESQELDPQHERFALPLRVPFGAGSPGAAELRASFTFGLLPRRQHRHLPHPDARMARARGSR